MTTAAPRSTSGTFHVVTVGWGRALVKELWRPIAAKSKHRFSHILHPRHTCEEMAECEPQAAVRCFCASARERMPEADRQLLAVLEREGVPTIHNMIMGDRVIAALAYAEALKYATFLARRLIDLFEELRPSVVVGSFDALHSGLALAVARHLNIPWVAPNFSVIPSGLACFCDRMSPAARVPLAERSPADTRSLAEKSLHSFEARSTRAPAYVAPEPRSVAKELGRLPRRMSAIVNTVRRARSGELTKFVAERNDYSVSAAVAHLYRTRAAWRAIARIQTLTTPPSAPFVLFGLHMQPESSIDVWAPFFSNQLWVIELLSRSIPPSHRLLIKIHKSDAARYSRRLLRRMLAYPGVSLVEPFADSLDFIQRADVVTAIQGTMGLEAALLGKPVIMLGDSPVTVFPSASHVGELDELPALMRRKLKERRPDRSEIVAAFAEYLAPFRPASHNDWTMQRDEKQIDGYVELFSELKRYLLSQSSMRVQRVL